MDLSFVNFFFKKCIISTLFLAFKKIQQIIYWWIHYESQLSIGVSTAREARPPGFKSQPFHLPAVSRWPILQHGLLCAAGSSSVKCRWQQSLLHRVVVRLRSLLSKQNNAGRPSEGIDECYYLNINKMLVCVLGHEVLGGVNKISALMKSLHSRGEC